MCQNDLTQSKEAKKRIGVITHIRVNFYEVECIKLALIGFSNGIKNEILPKQLSGIDLNYLKAQLRYLKDWFHNLDQIATLQQDGSNEVLLPFTSSELVDWLLPVCQSCVDNTAVLFASTENFSTEFAPKSSADLVKDVVLAQLRLILKYYYQLAQTYQQKLVDKLIAIQQQDYPLYPIFTESDE